MWNTSVWKFIIFAGMALLISHALISMASMGHQ